MEIIWFSKKKKRKKNMIFFVYIFFDQSSPDRTETLSGLRP